MDVYARVWRTGRKLGRTLYAQVGEQPGYDDVLLGLLETPEIATYVATLHNGTLAQRKEATNDDHG